MHPTLEKVLTDKPVIIDGAWGTQFQLLGLGSGESPDLWNLSHPERVLKVAKSYVGAGSQIILSNTFGLNRFTLQKAGVDADQVFELNKAGAAISRQACEGTDCLVFASMGPSGEILMMGQVTEDDLYEAFKVQAEGMAAGGADGIVIETMSCPIEASAAVRAAKTTGLPVVASMTFDSGKNKDRTMMGATPEKAAKALLAAGADILGSNCGKGIEGFIPVCQRLHDASGLPVWIKANRGLPEIVDGVATYSQTPEQFASFAPALVAAGAGFLGGCCGTDPSVIAALVEWKKNNRQ